MTHFFHFREIKCIDGLFVPRSHKSPTTARHAIAIVSEVLGIGNNKIANINIKLSMNTSPLFVSVRSVNRVVS